MTTPAAPAPSALPAAAASGTVTAPASAAVVPFHPKPRLEVPWPQVAVACAVAAGLAVAAVGGLLLAGRAPPALAGPLAGRGIDLLAVAFLVAATPSAYLLWRERARRLALDARLPDLLSDLASLHKAGLTLHESLLTAAKGDYGPLTPDVRQAADQVRWNVPVLTVLHNLQRRIRTPVSERTLAVVLEAGRTGGNVAEVLETAAANGRALLALREQRARSMGLYTIITYVASIIFIGVALSLQAVFVPRMIEAFGNAAGPGLGLSSGIPTAEEFRNLFYAAALVQSVGNGLVGGIMSDGTVAGGLRHSVAMVTLCFAGFLLA